MAVANAQDGAREREHETPRTPKPVPKTTLIRNIFVFNVSFRDCGTSALWIKSRHLIITTAKIGGLLCGILSLAYFGLRNDQLARWTAVKEFYALCNSDSVPPGLDCSHISGKVLLPPPYFNSSDIFLSRRSSFSARDPTEKLGSTPEAGSLGFQAFLIASIVFVILYRLVFPAGYELLRRHSGIFRAINLDSKASSALFDTEHQIPNALRSRATTTIVEQDCSLSINRSLRSAITLGTGENAPDVDGGSTGTTSALNAHEAAQTSSSSSTLHGDIIRHRLPGAFGLDSPDSPLKPYSARLDNLPLAFIADFVRVCFSDDICHADSGQVSTAIEGLHALRSHASKFYFESMPFPRPEQQKLTAAECRVQEKFGSMTMTMLRIRRELAEWVHRHETKMEVTSARAQELQMLVGSLENIQLLPPGSALSFAQVIRDEEKRHLMQFEKEVVQPSVSTWTHIRVLINRFIDIADDLIQDCDATVIHHQKQE